MERSLTDAGIRRQAEIYIRGVSGARPLIPTEPRALEAAGGRVPVLVDGGVRGGADVFKALAIGARAALVGRPYVYALALAGEAGVHELVANLVAELDLTMGLAGVPLSR